MVKTIVYTTNPNFVPTSLEQVINYAAENDKTITCYANEDSKLFNVEKGAHIVTGKGNHIYVLDTYDDMVEVQGHQSNISRIVSIDYPFGSKPSKAKSNLSMKNIASRFKSLFMPEEAEDVRIAIDGNICVATKSGYVAINSDNELVSYPSEMTIGMPVFIISKPINQLKVGDIIARERSYAKVVNIKNNKISTIGYTGAESTTHPVKDFLIGQSMVRVVMSLSGQTEGGNFNPMLFMALADGKKGDKMSSVLPFLMMQQNGGTIAPNPMLMMAMSGDDCDFKDLLVMSAISGNNLFGNMFQTPVVAKQPALATPIAKVAEPAEPALADGGAAEEAKGE